MGRGNRHGVIFRDADDYALFMKTLDQVKERFPFTLHAYCLMTNHYHLEVTTGKEPIWKIMQHLMNYYARTFNHKYGYDGHLFESRYTSCLIEDEAYFLEVSRYIHLNPVKAAMVREPLAYQYSSYKDYLLEDDCAKSCPFLDTSRTLGAFRGNQKEQYRMFVEGRISHEEQELLIMKDMGENELWLPW